MIILTYNLIHPFIKNARFYKKNLVELYVYWTSVKLYTGFKKNEYLVGSKLSMCG